MEIPENQTCVRDLFHSSKTASLPVIEGHRETNWIKEEQSYNLNSFILSGQTFNDLIPELTFPDSDSSNESLGIYTDLQVSQIARLMDPLRIVIPDNRTEPPHKDGVVVTLANHRERNCTGLLKVVEKDTTVLSGKRKRSPIRPEDERSVTSQSRKSVPRRRRFIYTANQLSFLEQMYRVAKCPCYNQVAVYSAITGVPVDRIQVWFQNRRSREKRQMRQASREYGNHQDIRT